MARELTTIIECPFELTGNYDITVNGSTAHVNGAGSTMQTWYRQALTQPANTGTTPITPASFGTHFGAVLLAISTDWSVNTTAPDATDTSRLKLTWNGVSPNPGTIDWGSGKGKIIRDLLGFTANVSLATGASIIAPNMPAYRLFTIERRQDSHWRPEAVGSSWSESDRGVVSGAASAHTKTRRRFTMGSHPTTPASTAVGSYLNNAVLPDLEGVYAGRLVAQDEDLSATSPPIPFTVLDFWSAARGRLLSAGLGTYKRLITGGTPYFDEVMLDADTCKGGPRISLRVAEWSELMDVGPWGLTMINPRQSL